MTPSERDDLVLVAAENQTTLTDVVREAVNTYVADYREGAVFFPRRLQRRRLAVDERQGSLPL